MSKIEKKQTQERIRQLVYRNLDSLFEELTELNDDKKKEMEKNNDS